MHPPRKVGMEAREGGQEKLGLGDLGSTSEWMVRRFKLSADESDPR